MLVTPEVSSDRSARVSEAGTSSYLLKEAVFISIIIVSPINLDISQLLASKISIYCLFKGLHLFIRISPEIISLFYCHNERF